MARYSCQRTSSSLIDTGSSSILFSTFLTPGIFSTTFSADEFSGPW